LFILILFAVQVRSEKQIADDRLQMTVADDPHSAQHGQGQLPGSAEYRGGHRDALAFRFLI
jgi:hypothetical protein